MYWRWAGDVLGVGRGCAIDGTEASEGVEGGPEVGWGAGSGIEVGVLDGGFPMGWMVGDCVISQL